MKTNTNPEKIKELLTRNVEDVIEKESLMKKIKSGKVLRIKHGIDPTGPKIHLGRAAQFWKLRAFQDLGHRIVLIIGDFTVRIGDASDKTAARRPLGEKEIKENMKNYKEQIGKILNMSKVELHYNSEWLKNLTGFDLIKLSMNFTAQQLIRRRNFQERWKKEKEIGLHELIYPLLQGYDSVAIRADIELGGSDQLFNLLAGRKIQESFGQSSQDIITLKMLPGLDGRKMSTSWGNIINITDSPDDMYGKIMSMRDELILDYFKLCTPFSIEEIEKVKKNLKEKKLNPRAVKVKLAKEIVSIYHGEKKAERTEKEFNKVFKEKKLPSKIPGIKIKRKTLNILDLLVKTRLTSSKSEAKRLVLQKGVKIDKEIQRDWQKAVKIKKGLVVQIGKRKFVKII